MIKVPPFSSRFWGVEEYLAFLLRSFSFLSSVFSLLGEEPAVGLVVKGKLAQKKIPGAPSKYLFVAADQIVPIQDFFTAGKAWSGFFP